MSIGLDKLSVSLTKHGAHKIAYLLKKYEAIEVLENVDNDELDIHIDRAQVRKILSIDSSGNIPDLWKNVKKYGEQDIFDLVFFAIVLSHHKLIIALSEAIKKGCVLYNHDVIGNKEYTNFAHIIDKFGYSIEHTPEYTTFDLSRIYYKFYMTPLFLQLLVVKLSDAGFDPSNDIIEETIDNDIHQIFGLLEQDFRDWMAGEELDLSQFAAVKTKRDIPDGIKFSPGHNTKYEGEKDAQPSKSHKVTFLHNKMQTKLYEILSLNQEYETGTEIPTNSGSIDIVQKCDNKYILYEIKTSENIRRNIRDAFSQLMEYAYWDNEIDVEKLVIISPEVSTIESRKYLRFLRKKYRIPIYYQSYNLSTNALGEQEN